ncbi:hypothetical protein F8M41_018024 [Gigaspora margarita]|uniref:Uncharacterized protein n=1 Tax=Gigaspora margarita TaxID=4874 RepID=A0A8H4ELI7_GIGMA|nr:hypothetical protein F8M41_018024 [Gigaspora margarita]
MEENSGFKTSAMRAQEEKEWELKYPKVIIAICSFGCSSKSFIVASFGCSSGSFIISIGFFGCSSGSFMGVSIGFLRCSSTVHQDHS